MFNTSGKGFKKYSAATHKITVAGNSIAVGAGADTMPNGQKLAYMIQNLPVMSGSGISVNGTAFGARVITNGTDTVGQNSMVADIASVTGQYDASKTNILVMDEITNQISIQGNTDTQVLAAISYYTGLVRASNRKWFIIMFTCLPRGPAATVNNTSDIIFQRNTYAKAVNKAIKSNPKSYGLDLVIDRTDNFTAPWKNMTSFLQADFNAVADYYTALERQVSSDSGLINQHTHPSEAGYTLEISLLDQAFRRIGNHF